MDNTEQVTETGDEAVLSGVDPLAKMTKTEAKVAAKLLPELTRKVGAAADAKYAAEYRTKFAQMQEANKEALRDAIKEVQKIAKPLDDEELKRMLTQEYTTFSVEVGEGAAKRNFTIRELPKKKEDRVIRQVREIISPILKKMSSVEWKALTEASGVEQLQGVLGLVPEALDAACQLVAICLNPDGGAAEVTGEWVGENLSTGRIVGILIAQMSANRYRDFFSLASQLFQQNRMLSL